MTQLSEAQIYAATKDPSILPDFTAKFTFTTRPNFDNLSLQFNLLSEKWWTQICAQPRGLAPQSNNVGINPGAGQVTIAMSPTSDTSYVVQPISAPFVSDLDSGVPNASLETGSVSFVCSMAGLKVTASLIDVSGAVLWTHTWDLLDAPYIFCFEVVGSDTGAHLDFLAIGGVLEYSSSQPVQGFMGPEPNPPGLDRFQWGTYADPRFFGGNAFPLYWENETGESSNVYTNVLTQDATHIKLEYSLTKGNQVFANPPLGTGPPTTLFNAVPPRKDYLGGWFGLTTVWTNPTSNDISGVVFIVLKNSFNQTVAIATWSGAFPANSSVSAFSPIANPPPSGAYKASAFVVSYDNRPLTPSSDSTVVI